MVVPQVLAQHLAQAVLALVAGAIATVLRQALGMATGRWLNLHVVRRRAVPAIAAVLTVALEINQQAHAALLRTTSARFPFAASCGATGSLEARLKSRQLETALSAHAVRLHARRRIPLRSGTSVKPSRPNCTETS